MMETKLRRGKGKKPRRRKEGRNVLGRKVQGRTALFRKEKKNTKRRKKSRKKTDKSGRKKAKIGSILYAGEGFSFRPFPIF
jgi:hypothetical protein